MGIASTASADNLIPVASWDPSDLKSEDHNIDTTLTDDLIMGAIPKVK
jgi:hypothetical protein